MNKIYIRIDENNEVIYSHHMPFDRNYGLFKTEEELLETGFFVEDIEEPEVEEGKTAIKKYNVEEGTLYYEFIDTPPTEEQIEVMTTKKKLEQLEQSLANAEYALMMGGLI